jgi:Porin subfamily
MRKLFILIAFVVLPAWPAVAQQSARQPDKAPKPDKPHSAKVNACAAYGPGFVKVEGSNTCIRVGGGVRVEGGGSRH